VAGREARTAVDLAARAVRAPALKPIRPRGFAAIQKHISG
jgi:hypothetical protein